MAQIKAAEDGNIVPDLDGQIEGISRTWGEILPGIENKS
jgi:hypothetical protein